MASVSFGEQVVVGDFEDGSWDGWWNAGWGATTAPVEENATLGTWSMGTDQTGWQEIIERNVSGDAELLAGMSTIGTVTLDVTASWNTVGTDGVTPYGWTPSVGLLVNADGYWGTPVWADGQLINGQTVSITLQLTAEAMAAVATGASGWGSNIGIMASSAGNEVYVDPITGEETLLYDGGAVMNFDNIQFSSIPEPATLVLLGLGSMAMLKQRKA